VSVWFQPVKSPDDPSALALHGGFDFLDAHHPDLEAAGAADAAEARIEAEHDFAEGGAIPFAFSSRFDIHFSHFRIPHP